ncbi:MAG: class I SAM-dependent rRNA methyltransferase [Acidobacteriota bacterium]|nr:class I SAM-dependent rRNA methyltransferase [Acidobacteriota bacterium]
MAAELRVILKPGREKSVRQGHPWLFSGAVARVEGGDPAVAGVAEVASAGGEVLGSGFYSPTSQIRVRLAAGPGEVVDQAFFLRRLVAAQALRDALVPEATTAFRLLNAEGDGVPGWTVDRYGDVLVSQVTSAGLEAVRDRAYDALEELLPQCSILQSNDLPARRAEQLPREEEVIRGEVPPEVQIQEHGLTFDAEILGGQKTGFYCDQRRNRRLVEELATGRRVLDLFAHTGGFGLYALRGGAREVVHVESSPRTVERGRAQYRSNAEAPGVDSERSEWIQGDVFAELRRHSKVYDLVVCDPPPLVPRRGALKKGSRAYKDLNRLALQRLAPGGLFLTFSCSGAVDAKLFRQILFSAASEAGVKLALLQPLGAAADHPVSVYHPEGEYLKGWLCRVAS